jgi:hypothetical protein
MPLLCNIKYPGAAESDVPNKGAGLLHKPESAPPEWPQDEEHIHTKPSTIQNILEVTLPPLEDGIAKSNK